MLHVFLIRVWKAFLFQEMFRFFFNRSKCTVSKGKPPVDIVISCSTALSVIKCAVTNVVCNEMYINISGKKCSLFCFSLVFSVYVIFSQPLLLLAFLTHLIRKLTDKTHAHSYLFSSLDGFRCLRNWELLFYSR